MPGTCVVALGRTWYLHNLRNYEASCQEACFRHLFSIAILYHRWLRLQTVAAWLEPCPVTRLTEKRVHSKCARCVCGACLREAGR
eukprot:10837789-Alexandrium_andersonii.AAC.1